MRYDTFSADLEKSNSEESSKQKAFEDLIAEKEKQVADWSAEVAGSGKIYTQPEYSAG